MILAFPCSGEICHMEQLASAVFIALLAVLVMVGKQQLHRSAAGGHRCGGGDEHLHAFVYRVYAGGNQGAGALNLHEADPAGTLGTFSVVEGAKGGYVISAGSGGLQYGQSLLYLIGDAFDFDVDLCHAFFDLLPAENLVGQRRISHVRPPVKAYTCGSLVFAVFGLPCFSVVVLQFGSRLCARCFNTDNSRE